MDEWRVDVGLTGSQKALSLPTGMGIVCASHKALEATKTATSVRVFFDWNDYLKFYNMGTYWPYSPSIQLLYGLKAALDLLFEKGLDNVIVRHGRLAKATSCNYMAVLLEWRWCSKTSVIQTNSAVGSQLPLPSYRTQLL